MTKKYTLCFKGKNEYGHEHIFPIISLDLKKMDEYTSRYDNYLELFNDLPKEVQNFIDEYISTGIDLRKNSALEKHIFIKDIDDIIFKNNIIVLNINSEGLTNLILNKLISYGSYQKLYLKTKAEKSALKHREFFKYLYDNYIKNEKILCMIDTFDVKKNLSFLKDEELLIAAIATDRDNIKVIAKKIGQSFETRRDLALMSKKQDENSLLNILISSCDISEDALDYKNIYQQMIKEVKKFKRDYSKEYELEVA